MKLPAHGLPQSRVFEELRAFRSHDLDAHGGRTWAYVYDSGLELVEEVARKAYAQFLSENALDPTAFPSLLRLENDLVALCSAHLNGDENTVGNFTSGGTESCMLAVKTARDYARATRPELGVPEILLPITAHAAFHKAAHYFGLNVVMTDVDPQTYRADVDAMRAAITPNTVLIVGSAVSYAHGVVDPIEALGQLALEHNLLFHVDGCIGGFLLPYYKRLGEPVPPFDFSVPGVTSISMDLHKYAYCPKGASVLLHKSAAVRAHQIFACAGWSGYTIVNPTIQSTRSGGPMAAAWAVMHLLGDDGYLKLADQTLQACQQILQGLAAIPALRVLGTPEASLIAFASDDMDVFHLVDEMKARGWYVQPQLASTGSPANIHLSVTAASLPRVPQMLRDLASSVEAARGLGPAVSPALMEQLEPQFAAIFSGQASPAALFELLGVRDGQLPARMAPINGLLSLMPSMLREQVLVDFVNQLYRPTP